MKKLIKVSSYILAITLSLVMFYVPAFAAGDNSDNGSLTGAQTVGGVAVLLLVILIPILKSSKTFGIK